MKEEIYNKIKNSFINIEVNKRVSEYTNNRYDLSKYYEIGKMIIEVQGGETKAKYGDKIISILSKRLSEELGKGYSTRTLKLIRKYYLFQKGQPVVAQLSWTHYTILLSLDNSDEINYYIDKCINNRLSKRKLQELIKTNEYQRLPEETKNKLINKEEISLLDEVKNPIVIYNSTNKEIVNEKALHMLIMYNIKEFLLELGDGFSYINDEYPIIIGNNYNYIDILLFNIKYNCYVVVELKATELKKEHLGQIQVYMNYIDNNVKIINHNKTIGIIICKKDNKYIIGYCSDHRIKSIEYKIFKNFK